jgi:phage terminase small subunit
LKEARGYPDHRRRNRAEPLAAPLASLEPPANLPPAAADIWRELAPIAAQVGVLDQMGARLFGGACRLQALAESHLAVAEAQKPGAKPGPSLWAGVKCLDKAAGFWSRFGMDPASRTRVRVGGTEDQGDELEAFRRAHPRRARQQAAE